MAEQRIGTDTQATEQWSLVHRQLHSRMKALEVIAVIAGVKPVARILCREENVLQTTSLLASLGLFSTLSDFKLLLNPTPSSSFVEGSVSISLHDSRRGHHVFYISKDLDRAKRAKQCEERQDHRGLGELLGYPPCCCAFFETHFSSSHTDLTLDTLEASSGWEFPLLTNIAARHVDASLLSHFPCSFSCSKSAELAKKILSIAKQCGQEDVFYLCGQTAVVYAHNEGIIFLQHPIKNGNTLSYSSATGTFKGKLYHLLSSHNRIIIHNKHSFSAGDDTVDGKDIGVMLFS